MGVNGGSMVKNWRKETLVPEPIIAAQWPTDAQFVSRYIPESKYGQMDEEYAKINKNGVLILFLDLFYGNPNITPTKKMTFCMLTLNELTVKFQLGNKVTDYAIITKTFHEKKDGNL